MYISFEHSFVYLVFVFEFIVKNWKNVHYCAFILMYLCVYTICMQKFEIMLNHKVIRNDSLSSGYEIIWVC